MTDIKKILTRYKKLPLVAIWKTIIISEGINSYLTKKEFNCDFPGFKFKYAIKNPISHNYEVLDRSSNQKVIPAEIILRETDNSALVKLRYNSKSAISMSLGGDKKKKISLFLNEGGKKIIIPLDIELLKERGDSVVSLLGTDRLSVVLFDGCWNWNTGCQCKFCDLNPKRNDFKSVVPNLNDLHLFNFNYQEWWEKYKKNFFRALESSFKKAYKAATPHKHLLIMSGGFINNPFLWEMIFELLKKLNNIVPLQRFDNYINVPAPTSKVKEKFLKLKRLGIKQIQINLEVATKKEFQKVCPGKDKSIGYDNYQKALTTAVAIFGRGHVRSNFVFTPRSSHALLKEANRLAKMGIVMDYSIFQPKKGTYWANKKSPSANEILNFSSVLSSIYKRYAFKGVYCNLSSRSSIINEILNYESKKL